MNILPKKSWHVRNKDNVARVRRDEAAAEEERRKRDARALRAEQEASPDAAPEEEGAAGGVGGGSQPLPPRPPLAVPPPEEGPNREHEEEKRREQERRERALGVLTYLGQSSAEAQTTPPWYLRPPPGRGDPKDPLPKAGGGPQSPPREVQKGRKAALDPLRDMKGKGRPQKPPPEPPKTPPRAPPGRARSKGLAELRRERLQREASEAARARALRGEGRDPPPKTPRDERQRPFNSQFHPQLARGGLRDPQKHPWDPQNPP